MDNNQLPVILLLGAQSQAQPLHSIPDELSKLNAILGEQADNNRAPYFKLDYHPYFTQQILKDTLGKLAGRLAILHFAGHSNPDTLLTDDGAVYSHHIASIINSWNEAPTLIFLNGCDNAAQVRLFHEAGVPLVIATRRRVNDQQAAEFARRFYSALFAANGRTPIQAAFEQASSQVLLTESRTARSIDLDGFEADDSKEWDWSLFPAKTADAKQNIHALLHQYATDVPTEQVFLSYSRTDKEAAQQLRDALVQEGFTVFRDNESIHLGDNWMQRLQDAVQLCSVFVLLVGREGVQQQRWVGVELEAALSRKLAPHDDQERLAIYPILLPEASQNKLPLFLKSIQSVLWHPQSSPLPVGLVDQLNERISLEDTPPVLSGEPYRGLSYFREQDADRFFGRHQEVLEALQKLGENKQPESDAPQPLAQYYRWLQVHASSGAGKSSLVRAGLLPKIRQGALWRRTGYAEWLILDVMMPGEKPVEMLAQILARAFPDKGMMGAWLSELNNWERPEGLSYALRSLAQPDQAILLVVDQLEELFTQSDTEQCRQFDRLIATALTDPDCPFFLISTIRSDFLDRFEYLPELQRIYNSHKSDYLLPTITENGLRELITLPARLSGMQVGDDLTEAIVRDARGEPGALPLTESALSELWNQARDTEAKHLSKSWYDVSQGVVGMLARRADTLIGGLGEKQRKAALNLLLALTQINEGGRHTRRRLSMDDAVHEAGGGPQGEAIVLALAGQHDDKKKPVKTRQMLPLIVTGQESDTSYVELVHEMLVRGSGQKDELGNPIGYWPTLYQYIHQHRDRDSQRQQLKVNAQRWKQAKGLGRYFGLAGWRDLRIFGKFRPRTSSLQGRYLRWSRWITWGQTLLLFGALGVLAESAWWVSKHNFPLAYIFIKPLWAAGLYKPLSERVTIPAGSFEMGCKPDRDLVTGLPACPENELPLHTVSLDYAFQMSQYEVTFTEYDYYLWDQGLEEGAKKPFDENWGRANRPVVDVNWNEASSYAKWLGQQIDQACRLPTEAEWEYAARGVSDTAYPWGNDVGENNANCDSCGSQWDDKQTAPVGSFPANNFGLHDMHGNVWEWVQDGWKSDYHGAPYDGSVGQVEGGDIRVLRGGSWDNSTFYSRSAGRLYNRPDTRSDPIGFRVVCFLPSVQ